MKKLVFLLCLFVVCNAFSQETVIENKHNISISYSCISFHNIGIGYDFVKLKQTGFHGTGDNFGFKFQYQFNTENIYIRLYYNRFTWDIPILWGFSLPYNLKNNNIGVSPHIGISFFGYAHLYYRYNLFLMEFDDNFHEFVIDINIPLF